MTVNTRHERNNWRSAGLLTAATMVLTLGAMLSGCGEEEAPPPPPKREAPPPPPPDPDPVQLSPLMGGADARVQFPQEKAPYDRSLAEAVIAFAGALASGDDAALSDSLTLSGRGILDSMLADGSWFDATDKIEAVRVVYLGQQPDLDEDASSADFVLAVQEPGGAYTLGWSATETDGGWVMSPVPTADATLPRAADWDGSSMGAYSSAAGWSGATTSGGGELGGSAGDDSFDPEYARLIQSEPILVYMDTEMAKRFFGQMLAAAPDPDAAIFQAISMQTRLSAADIGELFERGKAASGRGELPDAAAFKGYIDKGIEEIAEMQGTPAAAMMPDGLPTTKDETFEALASILGKTANELSDLYDSAP